jgi:hypothetical protein
MTLGRLAASSQTAWECQVAGVVQGFLVDIGEVRLTERSLAALPGLRVGSAAGYQRGFRLPFHGLVPEELRAATR